MKECIECHLEKNLLEYSSNKNSKDGLNNRCKECCSKRNKERYLKKKESIKEKSSLYYTTHKHSILNKLKEKPSYHRQNPTYYKEYREQNREKYNLYLKEYQRNNQKEKYHSDIHFRLQKIISNQVRSFLKGKKNQVTEVLLGYNYETFLSQIGNPLSTQHIDHKIPVSWFQENTPVNIIWHLDNLQLTSQEYNKSKLNSFADPVTDIYLNLVKPYIKPQYLNQL
jgi:hypothetical protein